MPHSNLNFDNARVTLSRQGPTVDSACVPLRRQGEHHGDGVQLRAVRAAAARALPPESAGEEMLSCHIRGDAMLEGWCAVIIAAAQSGPTREEQIDALAVRMALSGPLLSRGVEAAFALPTLNRFSMALLHGRAGRLTAKNGGCRPGQERRGPAAEA